MKISRNAAAAATIVTALAAALTGCSSPSGEDSPASAVEAKVSPTAIANAGHLTVCTALSTGNPPTYFTDESNNPIGAEVDMAKELGSYLGLDVSFLDVAFASIIPSLQAQKCDVIMSSLYIKPEREEIVDFVPYLVSGSALAVQTGNPNGITGMDNSLCGYKISAAVGKTATLLAEEQAKKCEEAGLPALTVVQSDQTTSAVQQLINKQVDAYTGETPVVLYYQQKQPDTFEMVGDDFGRIDVGAAVNKGNTVLADAISDGFEEMKSSGKYDEILSTWGMSDLAYDFSS